MVEKNFVNMIMLDNVCMYIYIYIYIYIYMCVIGDSVLKVFLQ